MKSGGSDKQCVTEICSIMMFFSLSDSDSECNMTLEGDLKGSDDNETPSGFISDLNEDYLPENDSKMSIDKENE